jgi:hypothetical protein
MTTQTASPLWAAEHGRSFDVPDVITTHPQIRDVSWHNDASPSFAVGDTLETRDVRLWVAHPEPSEREAEGRRYSVYDADNDQLLFESDTDADGAVNALLKAYADAT